MSAQSAEEVRGAINQLMMHGGMGAFYILDGQTPVQVYDFLPWAAWRATSQRQVAEHTGEGWRLSTVFLGRADRWGEGTEALFETALFADGMQTNILLRYATWEQALHGHWISLGKVSSLLESVHKEEPTDA